MGGFTTETQSHRESKSEKQKRFYRDKEDNKDKAEAKAKGRLSGQLCAGRFRESGGFTTKAQRSQSGTKTANYLKR